MGDGIAEKERKIFAKNLMELMRAHRITQDDIVRKLGYSSSTVSDWCNAKKYPRVPKMQELADLFSVPLSYLREDHDSPLQPLIPPGFSPLPDRAFVPRVGAIACGEPILAEQNIEDYDAVPSVWHADFTLVCRGDSMLPKFEDGDIVAIRKTPEVENGEIAAVRIDDEATLKRVYRYDDRIVLQPENASSVAPIVLIGEEMNRVTIEGKAVGLCRVLK